MKVIIDRYIEGAARSSGSKGTVVIIDVLRAFTTAPYIFAAGARTVYPVASISDAFALRASVPGSLIAGERDGFIVPGFDLGNSPSVISGLDLSGRTIITRTSAGTQGVSLAMGAPQVMLGSFVTLTATAAWIRTTEQHLVTLVAMGDSGIEPAEEDELCAEMLRDAIEGKDVRQEFDQIRARVLACPAAVKFLDPVQPEFPEADLQAALDLDRFGFALRVVWPLDGGPARVLRTAGTTPGPALHKIARGGHDPRGDDSLDFIRFVSATAPCVQES